MLQLQAATSEGYCRVKISLLVSVLARRIQSFSTDMLSQKSIFSEKNFHPQILVVVYNGYKNISHFASQPDKANTNTVGSNFSFGGSVLHQIEVVPHFQIHQIRFLTLQILCVACKMSVL